MLSLEEIALMPRMHLQDALPQYSVSIFDVSVAMDQTEPLGNGLKAFQIGLRPWLTRACPFQLIPSTKTTSNPMFVLFLSHAEEMASPGKQLNYSSRAR